MEEKLKCTNPINALVRIYSVETMLDAFPEKNRNFILNIQILWNSRFPQGS